MVFEQVRRLKESEREVQHRMKRNGKGETGKRERSREWRRQERDGRDRWEVRNVQFFKVKQGRQLASNRVLLLGVHDNIQAHILTAVLREMEALSCGARI